MFNCFKTSTLYAEVQDLEMYAESCQEFTFISKSNYFLLKKAKIEEVKRKTEGKKVKETY